MTIHASSLVLRSLVCVVGGFARGIKINMFNFKIICNLISRRLARTLTNLESVDSIERL